MNKKRYPIFIVILTTFLTAFAQVLYKKGANLLSGNVIDILYNYNLILGFVLYAIGAILLIIALKHGEVSVLYPIIASSYIWVGFLAKIFFNESMNFYKWGGVFLIILGIIVINLRSEPSKASEAV